MRKFRYFCSQCQKGISWNTAKQGSGLCKPCYLNKFKGENHPAFGKKRPAYVGLKISKSKKGKKCSAEHIENIRISHMKHGQYSVKTIHKCSCGNKKSPFAKLCRKCHLKQLGISKIGNPRPPEVKVKMAKSFFKKGHKPWNTGINPYINVKLQIRASIPYKEWRKKVLVRDNYTCQNCGKKGGQLESHHKMPFVAILKKYKIASINEALKCEKLWDINNGKTLCEKCHDDTKRIYNFTHFGGEPISVYLSGYINNNKLELCSRWRKQIAEHYNNWGDGEGYPLVWLDPMNGEVGTVTEEGMTSSLVPGKALVHRDFYSVKKANIIVANLDTFGESRPMIGTLYELAWAWEDHKPVIIITKDPHFIKHPFIQNTASMMVSSVEELLEKKYLNYLFKGFVTAEVY